MDRRTLWAIGICFLIMMAWQKYYLDPIQQQQQAYEAQKKVAAEQAAKTLVPPMNNGAAAGLMAATEASKPAAPSASVKTAVLENENSRVNVSNNASAVDGWELEGFSKTLGHKEDKVTLGDASGFPSQLKLRFSDAALSRDVDQTWGSLETQGRTATSRIDTAGVRATRVFSLDDTGYGGNLRYTFHFGKEVPKYVFLDLFGSSKRANDTEGSIFGQRPDKVNVTYRDANGRWSKMGAQLKENHEATGNVTWLGLDTRYFVLAVVPQHIEGSELGTQVTKDNLADANSPVRGSIVFPTNGKTDLELDTRVYFGPKDMAALTKVSPVLSDTIDFGWFTVIAIPLLQALKWLYSFVGNYGIAIILLTFGIKMALFPLMYKSMKSMAKMSVLQPQLNALREKYKDDKEKLNVEMMNFMKANGYNPVGGCLPIVFQMPIFFALYRVLFNSMELYQAPFGLWIHDLSSPDPFFVTPVLLMGLMYLQQKLSPNTAADPAQQKMMQIMPVMFGAFMFMLPSGLTIYMVVNSAVSIAQQYFLNHKLGIKKKPLKAQPA
jgi:YidC/Oxa1 family membrane protein insertase